MTGYTKRARGPAVRNAPRVGIIGAGLSGLMAGRVLQDRGLHVTLFDKGRRPGGRANTREHGPFLFDHGAQFFTVRDPLIRPFLDSWLREGVVTEWKSSLVRIQGKEVEAARDSTRYVGVPGMIALAEHLAQHLDVRVNHPVERLRKMEGGWALHTADPTHHDLFDIVIVAVPAPQAVPLLAPAPRIQDQARGVEMAPCWAGMYVFAQPLDLAFDGAFLSGQALSWVARDSSKPGRPDAESWVLHAGPEWTRDHWDRDREEVAEALAQEFGEIFGPLPEVVFSRAHRWAYALASDPTPGGALYDAERQIGACGDWCQGGRMEGALVSGMAVADRISG